MRPSAIEPTRRRRRLARELALVLAIVLTVATTGRAQANVCGAVPLVDDTLCDGAADTIDGYKQCYAKLYDESVIPVFDFIARCSHPRADAALRTALESAGAVVTRTVRGALASMEAAMAASGPQTCMQQMNGIGAALAPYLAAEAAAPDLPAYRRASYTYSQFVAFTDLLLAARENRATCGAPLSKIRDQLRLLQQLKVSHLNYCAVLEDSAKYEDFTKLSSLAQWTRVDPNIDFGQHLEFSITWNTHCSTFDISNAQTTYTPCAQGTFEYQNVLTAMDDSFAGWLAEHRNAISAATAATVSTIAWYAGYGSYAGPIGAAAATAVAVVIGALQYWSLREDIEELEELIDDKERELKTIVEANYITAAQFDGKRAALCGGWEAVMDQRIQSMLSALDTRHLQKLDGYFALNDKLQRWYNDLLLWAVQPDAEGERFLDELAEQGLLAQRYQFDEALFRARAEQEMAAQENLLVNQKGALTALSCLNIPAPQKRGVQIRLRGGINSFNLSCNALTSALALATPPLAFASSSPPAPPPTSDVQCDYRGFRTDVEAIEVQDGAGSSATLVVKNGAGAQVAVAANITSATPRAAYGVPGLFCASPSGAAFGTSASTELAPGAYPLTLINNIYGFEPEDADQMRLFLKDIDEDVRVKSMICTRQLGSQTTVPRTADACGIPVGF
jgi:hypothetical protein